MIPSEVRLVDVAHAAAEKVAAMAGFDEDEALNVGLAVREAVINAILHGNRLDSRPPGARLQPVRSLQRSLPGRH